MGIFSFTKGIGEKLRGNKQETPAATPAPTPQAAPKSNEPDPQMIANLLINRIQAMNLAINGLSVHYDGATDTAEIKGTAKTQADREKAILAAGNVDHVAKVVDHIMVETASPESKMYTVKSGDNLSKISKEVYGDANQYQKIFEANQPMLSSPDKIYPGQVLRIPA